MSSHPISVASPADASATSPVETFERHVSVLTARSQQDTHIFTSPLGPLVVGGTPTWLPRFVFFGPHTTDESWRLAFLAGFDRADLRSSRALLHFAESLADRAEDGYGLNLTFFPLIDVAGSPARSLRAAHWAQSTAPEIALLEKDARLRGYHGFIRVETASPEEEIIGIRVREPFGIAPSPDVELISSEDVEPFAVRFEREPFLRATIEGPLSIADDFVVQPFELTLRIPASWSDELYFNAVRSILGRFVLRYRAFQAYGQHL